MVPKWCPDVKNKVVKRKTAIITRYKKSLCLQGFSQITYKKICGNTGRFWLFHDPRNQVIPNGTEGSNPSLSAKNKGYSVCYTLYFFVDKTARDSNPYNLLQDEVLSKEVYNRIVCVANSRANEVSRIPHSPPRIKGIAFAIPFIFLLIRQQGIRTRTVGFADENSPVDCLKVRG